VWRELRDELSPFGFEVVTVALDLGGVDAVRPWIEAAAPSHPSLIDRSHLTDELLGFTNVPMAVWISEDGMIVRPAHPAHVKMSALREGPLPEGLPPGLLDMLTEVRKIHTDPDAYVAALRDWAEHGAASRYALSPDEVVDRSQPRGKAEAEAAACFELGQHLWQAGDHDAAVPWFRRAHELQPGNWTYKRQAWSLATTAEGQPTDLMQGPTDLYEGSWLKDVKELGAEHYYPPLDF
jgi:hypothetical protein